MKTEYIQNIKKLRIEKGLSQKEMAERLGFGHSNYNKIENGLIELNVSKLYEIADILEVPILRILGGEEFNKLIEFIKKDYEKQIRGGLTNWIDNIGSELTNAFKNPIPETPEKKEDREKRSKEGAKDRFEKMEKLDNELKKNQST